MLGFELNFWDYLTFLVIFALVGAFLTIAVLVQGLPGRIAIARHILLVPRMGNKGVWLHSKSVRVRSIDVCACDFNNSPFVEDCGFLLLRGLGPALIGLF